MALVITSGCEIAVLYTMDVRNTKECENLAITTSGREKPHSFRCCCVSVRKCKISKQQLRIYVALFLSLVNDEIVHVLILYRRQYTRFYTHTLYNSMLIRGRDGEGGGLGFNHLCQYKLSDRKQLE